MKVLITAFDDAFSAIHNRSCKLLENTPEELLFAHPNGGSPHHTTLTIGENLLRSIAAVEQTFGGITASLWDDPFEWTLPEQLMTLERIRAYLLEVESTRCRGLGFIKDDNELTKLISSPTGMRTIFEVTLAAVARAEHFLGRAYEAFHTVTGTKPPA